MSIVEDFKLDMADEFDISFAEASNIFSLMISLAIEQAPGRIGRQRMVNAVAQAITNDRIETVNNFKVVLDNKDAINKSLDAAAGDRAVRSANNSFRKIEKLMRELNGLAK